MPTGDDREPMDSIAAAAKLAKSNRVRSLAHVLWPLALAAATWGIGYWQKATETHADNVATRLELSRLRDELAALRDEVRTTPAVRRDLIRVGKQAAFATACCEAYEATGVIRKKRVYAGKYANAYERMAGADGQSAEVAFTALFHGADVP